MIRDLVATSALSTAQPIRGGALLTANSGLISALPPFRTPLMEQYRKVSTVVNGALEKSPRTFQGKLPREKLVYVHSSLADNSELFRGSPNCTEMLTG